jgi:heme exporter protein D
MIWDSWSDLIAMGGYARYVWGSFAVVALMIVGEQVSLAARRRAAAHAVRALREDGARS